MFYSNRYNSGLDDATNFWKKPLESWNLQLSNDIFKIFLESFGSILLQLEIEEFVWDTPFFYEGSDMHNY